MSLQISSYGRGCGYHTTIDFDDEVFSKGGSEGRQPIYMQIVLSALVDCNGLSDGVDPKR